MLGPHHVTSKSFKVAILDWGQSACRSDALDQAHESIQLVTEGRDDGAAWLSMLCVSVRLSTSRP